VDKLFKDMAKSIKIYLGKENIDDPYEKNVSLTTMNPIPIKAIISDLTFAKIQWAMPGIVADKAKEITIKIRHKSLLEMSQKIEIDGEFYEGWRQNSKMQTRKEGNYLRCYIYLKKV